MAPRLSDVEKILRISQTGKVCTWILKLFLYEAGRKFEIHRHQRSLGVQLGQLEQIKCKNKTSAYICKKCLSIDGSQWIIHYKY